MGGGRWRDDHGPSYLGCACGPLPSLLPPPPAPSPAYLGVAPFYRLPFTTTCHSYPAPTQQCAFIPMFNVIIFVYSSLPRPPKGRRRSLVYLLYYPHHTLHYSAMCYSCRSLTTLEEGLPGHFPTHTYFPLPDMAGWGWRQGPLLQPGGVQFPCCLMPLPPASTVSSLPPTFCPWETWTTIFFLIYMGRGGGGRLLLTLPTCPLVCSHHSFLEKNVCLPPY